MIKEGQPEYCCVSWPTKIIFLLIIYQNLSKHRRKMNIPHGVLPLSAS